MAAFEAEDEPEDLFEDACMPNNTLGGGDAVLDLTEGYLFDTLGDLLEERSSGLVPAPTELDNSFWYLILETVQDHDRCKYIGLTTCLRITNPSAC